MEACSNDPCGPRTVAPSERPSGDRLTAFIAMGRITTCPHPLHLRLFSDAQSRTNEAVSVREHLEHCETCRAVVAGFAAEDNLQNTCVFEDAIPPRPPGRPRAEDEVQNTVIFEDPTPPRRVERSRAEDEVQNTCVFEGPLPGSDASGPRDDGGADREKSVDAAEATVEFSMPPPAADDGSGPDFQISDSPPRSRPAPGTDPAATGEFVLGADSSSDQLGFSDSNVRPTMGDGADRSIRAGSSTIGNVTVPGYDILEELGRGGMGVVYKARHRRLQRMVALKMVLSGVHVGAVGLARFRAEAEAVARLSHPNIVQIYETGEHDGLPFFSLELVDGGSLDQRIRESPTSPRAAAQLIETLARTMAMAHDRGIIHRDLKPANILLAKMNSQSSMVRSRELDSHASLPSDHWSRNTVPKIADFGLAKQMDDDSSQTRTGTILGTPSYMAPEQAGGKNREIGPPADIYSARRHPVRAAGRPPAVPGGQPDRHDPPGHRAGAGPAAPARAARPA